MAGEAPDVKITVSAEDQGVTSAINELTANLKNLKGQQNSVASSAGKLSGALKGVAAAVSIGALVAFGKSIFDSAVSMARLSKETGVSTETLSVFHHAASDLGVSTDSVDKGVTKVSRAFFQLSQGSAQTVLAFKAIGLSQKDFIGLNTDQKLLKVANALAQYKDTTDKAAVAQLLFSRGGTELLPVLDELAGDGYQKAYDETKKYGDLLDGSAAEAMQRAKKGLADVGEQAKGAALQFEEGMVPALADVSTAISDSFGGAGGFKQVGEDAGKVIRYIAEGFLNLGAYVAYAASRAEDAWDLAVTHVKENAKGLAVAAGTLAITQNPELASKAFQAVSGNTASAKDFAARGAAEYAELQKQLQLNYLNTVVPGASSGGAPAHHKPSKTIQPGTMIVTGAKDALAAEALLRQRLSEELEIYKANQAVQAQAEKNAYAQGKVTLQQYYDFRKKAVEDGLAEELGILQQELKAEQEALAKNKTKSDASTPLGRAYLEAAQRNAAEIAGLQTKITVATSEAQAKELEIEGQRASAQQRAAAEAARKAQEEARKSAESARKGLKGIGSAARESSQQVISLTQDFASYFDEIDNRTLTTGQKFQLLASVAVRALGQIIAAQIKKNEAEKAGDSGGSGSSGGGALGFLGAILGAFGHARGGLISGPGGPAGDRIPALLSDGEFVMSAKSVRAIGADTLDSVNRGLQLRPATMNLTLPHYSSGGLVTKSAAEGSTHTLEIGLDEGLVLKHLSSKGAARVILNQLANNPKGAGKALSRSD